MQENPSPAAPPKAGVGAYIALLFAVIFFSGISVSEPVKNFGTTLARQLNVEPKKVHDIFSVFDFNTLNGKFGKVIIPDAKAKDTKAKDAAAKDAAAKDAAAKDAAAKDAAAKDVAAKDVAAKDVAAKDVAAKDVAAKDVAAKDVAAKDVAAKDAAAKDAAAKDAAAKDAKAKEAAYTTGNFSGEGGVGARQGFMFALTLAPTTLFAMGIIAVLEHYGALEAMRRLLQRTLKWLMGIPGDTGLAMIASFQSTDAGAALTRSLYDQGQLSTRERDIFTMFQFSAGATITNFLGSGAALLALTSVAADGTTQGVPTTIGICFAVLFFFKFFGANLMRLYLNFADRKPQTQAENQP